VSGHALERTAWLSDEILLLACSPAAERARAPADDRAASATTIEARAFVTPRGALFAAATPPESLRRPGPLRFLDGEGAEALTVEAEATAASLAGLRTLLREGPAGWNADERTALIGFLAALGAERGLSGSLSDGLRLARDALRERRPATVEDRRAERGIVVEGLHRIDERSFYLRGRCWDREGPIASLAATTPEGERVELLEDAFRHPGLGEGFVSTFRTAAPTAGEEGWVVEAASGPGRAVEAAAAPAPDGLEAMLAAASLDFAGATDLREHLRPAISRLHGARRREVEVTEVEAYGRVAQTAAVSVIVPLQRRVDLIEHQIAQFAGDPALAECELLYVLADPEQGDLLRELSGELHRLYGLPFRVATLSGGGLAIACDIGASLAVADRLLLLGSDVLPDRPGWVAAMSAALDAGEDNGVVAPKLLYEDEAIDAAGLEYERRDGEDEWRIEGRFRGMHRDFEAANAAGPVPAAAIACAMIDAAALREVGGLSGEYGLGDYEGSELSRRLAIAGLATAYAPEARLYRLEGLGAAPEAVGERYARWLHSRNWGLEIEAGR
jgi:O-antigen biosynthesis protein